MDTTSRGHETDQLHLFCLRMSCQHTPSTSFSLHSVYTECIHIHMHVHHIHVYSVMCPCEVLRVSFRFCFSRLCMYTSMTYRRVKATRVTQGQGRWERELPPSGLRLLQNCIHTFVHTCIHIRTCMHSHSYIRLYMYTYAVGSPLSACVRLYKSA